MLILLLIIVIIVYAFLFAFLETSGTLGRQAALTNLRYSIFYILVAFLIIFIIGLLRYDPQDSSWPEKNSWLNAYNVVIAILILTGIDSFLRKMKAGALLLDLGKNPKNKQLLWVGLFLVSIGAFNALIFFRSSSFGGLSRSLYQWSIFYCIFGIYNLALGMSGLEFRENGIWFMCSLIKWQQIKSYIWDLDKVNVVTIRFKPRFPLSPASTSLAIPERYRDAVNQILNERLPR